MDFPTRFRLKIAEGRAQKLQEAQAQAQSDPASQMDIAAQTEGVRQNADSTPYVPEPRMEGDVVLYELFESSVIHRGDVVIKQGPRVSETESDALQFLEPFNLPVPRFLRFERSTDRMARLEMSYMEGERLDKVWPTMTSVQKKNIALQLRQILIAIRSIENRSPTIGSCNGGPVRDCRRIMERTGGPFPDEESFNNEFYLDLLKQIPPIIREAMKNSLRTDHRIVFSHGDLAQHNILVKDNQIQGLIDWEYAGWFPEHWEYIKFFERTGDPEFRAWMEYAKDIFVETYDDQLVIHQAVLRWQRP